MQAKFLVLSFILIFSGNIFSQNFLFKVVASNGKCTIQKKSASKWEPLSTGALLSSGDKVKLESNDYLGLMHVKGKSFELKGSGTFDVAELSAKVSGGQTTLQKFAGFVLNEATAKKKSDNMKTLGAVVRANPDAVEVYFPSFTSLFNTELKAQWYPVNEQIKYTFEILNNENRPLYIQETADTSITVDLSKMNLVKNQNYKWLVYKSGVPNSMSDTLFFSLPDEKQLTSISDTLNILKTNIDQSSAVDLLLLAGFYESNKLNLEAAKTYDKILESVPGVGDYFNIYASFLLKYNMLRRAQFLLNN